MGLPLYWLHDTQPHTRLRRAHICAGAQAGHRAGRHRSAFYSRVQRLSGGLDPPFAHGPPPRAEGLTWFFSARNLTLGGDQELRESATPPIRGINVTSFLNRKLMCRRPRRSRGAVSRAASMR
jgi:hypothetical protein